MRLYQSCRPSDMKLPISINSKLVDVCIQRQSAYCRGWRAVDQSCRPWDCHQSCRPSDMKLQISIDRKLVDVCIQRQSAYCRGWRNHQSQCVHQSRSYQTRVRSWRTQIDVTLHVSLRIVVDEETIRVKATSVSGLPSTSEKLKHKDRRQPPCP